MASGKPSSSRDVCLEFGQSPASNRAGSKQYSGDESRLLDNDVSMAKRRNEAGIFNTIEFNMICITVLVSWPRRLSESKLRPRVIVATCFVVERNYRDIGSMAAPAQNPRFTNMIRPFTNTLKQEVTPPPILWVQEAILPQMEPCHKSILVVAMLHLAVPLQITFIIPITIMQWFHQHILIPTAIVTVATGLYQGFIRHHLTPMELLQFQKLPTPTAHSSMLPNQADTCLITRHGRSARLSNTSLKSSQMTY